MGGQRTEGLSRQVVPSNSNAFCVEGIAERQGIPGSLLPMRWRHRPSAHLVQVGVGQQGFLQLARGVRGGVLRDTAG